VSVGLAATWHPRGELDRALRMVDDLTALYAAIVIVVPPDALHGDQNGSDVSALAEQPAITVTSGRHGPNRRHSAVENALASGTAAIHNCELRQTVDRMAHVDCLITGRTDQAWATHPRCMIETEILFNMIFSHLINHDSAGGLIDFGAGSRGLSRRAAEHLMQYASPEWGWAIDAAWPLLLHHAGYTLDYVAVNGLEWETPDQVRDTAADPATRSAIAAQHDQSPEFWQQRVYVAHEVLRTGLLAADHIQEKQPHD
jgi:hypothetical protein